MHDFTRPNACNSCCFTALGIEITSLSQMSHDHGAAHSVRSGADAKTCYALRKCVWAFSPPQLICGGPVVMCVCPQGARAGGRRLARVYEDADAGLDARGGHLDV